jgi:hypothetical protein
MAGDGADPIEGRDPPNVPPGKGKANLASWHMAP